METTKFSNGSRLFNSSYIVDDFISDAGATGNVYLVHRENEQDKKFAAKVVYRKPEWTDAYWNKFAEEEVTNLRIMNQENLVQTYDTFSINKKDLKAKVLIMEHVDGISLRKYIALNGVIPSKTALNIFRKILVGIRVLHHYKHQIIHRDLKPENIMISKDLSKVTILDFGIATVMQSAQDNLESKNIQCFTDESGQTFGTMPYVTPDASKKTSTGQKLISVQFDFYSLGVILYEMLMGERPFDYDKLPVGYDDAKKLKLALSYDIYNISSNPTITPTIENMIFRCLACQYKDLIHRYKDIDELIADCDKAIESLSLKQDNTPLLKPLSARTYPRFGRFYINSEKDMLPIYKRWPFFLSIAAVGITILIVALVVFFK